MAWIIVYCVIWKGLHNSGKVIINILSVLGDEAGSEQQPSAQGGLTDGNWRPVTVSPPGTGSAAAGKAEGCFGVFTVTVTG